MEKRRLARQRGIEFLVADFFAHGIMPPASKEAGFIWRGSVVWPNARAWKAREQ